MNLFYTNSTRVPKTAKVALWLLVLGLWQLGAVTPRGAANQPNILMVLTDDQRADTIHALGNPHIQTPNLDRLAQSGMAFTRAYCMGGLQGAVCVPARAMFLSGRTLFRASEKLQGQATWPEVFGRAGYHTFITGKWHNEAPALLRSFKEGRAIFLGGMGDPYALPLRDIGPNGKLANPRQSGRHSVEIFADAAIEFLKRQKPNEPFLAYVALNAPHDPRVAPAEFMAPYQAQPPPLPANYLPVHPFDNGEMVVRDEKLAPWPRAPETVRRHLADYYGCITFMDAQIGRILKTLQETGLEKQTLVVFASDQGLAIGSHGLFGKQNLYEHSMRIPLIVAGPGIPRGRQTGAFCYLLDLFPTLGELTGVAGPEGSEGISLAPVFLGRSETARDSIFTAYRGLQRAVRDERWKLLVYPAINKVQLFDLKLDPAERDDRADREEAAPEKARLLALMADWQKRLGDRQPLKSADPKSMIFDFSKAQQEATQAK